MSASRFQTSHPVKLRLETRRPQPLAGTALNNIALMKSLFRQHANRVAVVPQQPAHSGIPRGKDSGTCGVITVPERTRTLLTPKRIIAGTRCNDDHAVSDDDPIQVRDCRLRFHLCHNCNRQRQGAGPYEPISHEYAFLLECRDAWRFVWMTN